MRPKYVELAESLRRLLNSLLEAESISASIEARAKTLGSFAEKVARDGKSYTDPLAQITDLCGLRIIVLTLDDVSLVERIIRREMIVDEENSISKGASFEMDRFGYKSVHLVAQIGRSRKDLAEWRDACELKAEIQIRTIGQHAWAAAEHALAYKTEIDVPLELRRRLFRLSALFELADQEIGDISRQSARILSAYRAQINKQDTILELNVESLRAYIECSPTVETYVKVIRDLNVNVTGPGALSRDVTMATMAGVNTIGDLDHLFIKAKDWLSNVISSYIANCKTENLSGIDAPMSVDLNGIVTIVLIASFGETFTQKALESDLGFGLAWRVIEPARTFNPRYLKSAL